MSQSLSCHVIPCHVFISILREGGPIGRSLLFQLLCNCVRDMMHRVQYASPPTQLSEIWHSNLGIVSGGGQRTAHLFTNVPHTLSHTVEEAKALVVASCLLCLEIVLCTPLGSRYSEIHTVWVPQGMWVRQSSRHCARSPTHSPRSHIGFAARCRALGNGLQSMGDELDLMKSGWMVARHPPHRLSTLTLYFTGTVTTCTFSSPICHYGWSW